MAVDKNVKKYINSERIFFLVTIIYLIWCIWSLFKLPSFNELILMQDAAAWVQALGGLFLIMVTVIIFLFDRRERLIKDAQEHLNSVAEAKIFIINNGNYHSLIFNISSLLVNYGFENKNNLIGKYDEKYPEIYMLRALLHHLQSLVGVNYLFINMSAPLGVPKMCISFYFEVQRHIAEIANLLEYRKNEMSKVAGIRDLEIVKKDLLECEKIRDLQVELRTCIILVIDKVNAISRLNDDLFKSLGLKIESYD